MNTETYFLEKKYSKFTENMKNSLKKAVHRGNVELATVIQDYLDIITEMKKVHTLKKKNDVATYREDIKMYEEKLEKLQLKIIDIQFNKTNIYNKDIIVIDIPKYINNDMNYLFMFIYKYIQINSKILCMLFKNIVDDLYNLKILDENDIEHICKSEILKNISIVYNKNTQKISYKYRTNFNQIINNKMEYENIQKKLDSMIDKLNEYDINKNVKTFDIELNQKTQKDFKVMLASILINLLRDIHCPITKIQKTGYDLFMEDKEQINEIYIEGDGKISYGEYDLTKNELKEKMNKKWQLLSETDKKIYENKVKNNFTHKFSNTKLKQYICNYFTINPKYNINKEYDLLYNYFLTRDLSKKKTTTQKNDSNINITIPHFSLSFINNLVLFIYIFIKNNKADICNNLKKFLNKIRTELINQTYSSYENGDYFYKQGKILSLCSNSPNAHKLINTFYSKYKEYDKIVISNLLLKIINNNSLKIKYDMVNDKFEVVIINTVNLDIDFNEIDKSKLLEGLNEDLKCINSEINKTTIIKIIDFITKTLNKILNMFTDEKIITSIFNLSTDSQKIYSYIKNPDITFKIRKLFIIIFIKFITSHISKFYTDPYSTQYNMYESLMKDIHKNICETLTVEFNYNVFQKMEELYEELPSYEI